MNLWLGVEQTVLQKIKELVTMLHEASLLIDDIQDNSKMRRGQPAAYLIYGVSEVGIFPVDCLFSRALPKRAKLLRIRNSRLFLIYC